MRTRLFAKMSNHEVERYLERNDLIFVPVGTTETHGYLPLDCETVLAEGIGLRMAEAADGVVLTGLPYFFPGNTNVGRGTVHIDIKTGIEYLSAIAHSLLRQGFCRQVYLTQHGPGHLTVGSMVRDFFEHTKVPILYIDTLLAASKNREEFSRDEAYDMFFGAYDIMGQLDFIPLDEDESESLTYKNTDKNSLSFASHLFGLGGMSSSIGHYLEKPFQHGSGPRVKTAEERLARAKSGRNAIDKLIKKIDIVKAVETLRELDKYQQEVILPAYQHLR